MEGDYEVIGITLDSESRSSSDRLVGLGDNVRIVDAPHAHVSDIAWIESVLDLVSAPTVGFLNGMPVVTPRLIEHVLAATRLFERPVVAVPGYEFGADREEFENVLLRADPRVATYDSFEAARFAPTNAQGYLSSLLESDAFFCRREACARVLRSGGTKPTDTRDLYARLLRDPSSSLVAIGGEGCFRSPSPVRVPAHDLWFRPDRQPTLFGVLPGQSLDFFKASIGFSAMHEAIAREAGSDEWPLDPRRSNADGTVEGRRTPRLSIAIVAYKIPRQIENTLYSLSTKHQWNVSDDDYEIIVVENRSTAMLGERRALGLGRNVRYFLREETGVSPAPAMNYATSQARGDLLGVMIDGARMATPRVIEHALLAAKIHPRPIIVVPGYHLGPGRQHLTTLDGYDESVEMKLLDGVDWRRSGYSLFDIACFDEATKNGFLNPILEATYLFTTRECWNEVGGLEELFDSPGGGEVNHDLFERLCRLPNTRYVVLWGEGNFHQYHGGVSTKAEDRERKLEAFRNQYDRIRGHRFQTFEREPWLLGASCGSAYARFEEAAALGRFRYGMVRDQGKEEWENG